MAERGASAPSDVRMRIVYDARDDVGVSAASDALLTLLGTRERAIRPQLEPDTNDEPLDDQAT